MQNGECRLTPGETHELRHSTSTLSLTLSWRLSALFSVYRDDPWREEGGVEYQGSFPTDRISVHEDAIHYTLCAMSNNKIFFPVLNSKLLNKVVFNHRARGRNIRRVALHYQAYMPAIPVVIYQ